MFKVLKYSLFFLGFFSNGQSTAQVNVSKNFTSSLRNSFVNEKDVFGSRVFVENRGQFGTIEGNKVIFVLDNDLEKIYFTAKGLVYELKEFQKLTHEDWEKMERGDTTVIKPNKPYFVHMNWLDPNPDVFIESSEKQSHRVSYGEPQFNSQTFKKITYKNIYTGIDIEYTIPEEKTQGVKYNVIVHPGADLNQIKFKYSGDVQNINRNELGEIIIQTPLEDIIEHAPLSFYEDRSPINSTFLLHNNIIGFDLTGIQRSSKTIIIDPWVSTTNSLTNNYSAYDVDYDYMGNTFVYGGNGNYKVAMYSGFGVLQWVFAGAVVSQGWAATQYAGNFGVDKFTSKTYIGQGFDINGNRIIRLDALGNYDSFISFQNVFFREVWDMGFHCTTASVFVLGGGTNSNISAVTMNTVSGAVVLSTFQPGINTIAHDVVSHAIDDAGNIFVIYAGAVAVHNKISLVNSTFNGNVWTQPSGYNSFVEAGNKAQYTAGGATPSNGFNALAVNGNFVFYYDGYNLAAYNKTTGSQISATTVSGHSVKQQGGIAVDDCNNIYLGGNGAVRTFSYNGSTFTPLASVSLSTSATNPFVYDIKLDKNTKILYVCGNGFVGTYSPIHTLACPTASSLCLFSQGGISVVSTSITCANLGSATCTAIGGVGPFTYTWLPSMQTGSVAVGLSPGSHLIVVNDIGNNATYTASTFLAPLAPFTGSVNNPLALDCYGVFNGTAAVNNLSGGSGSQSYLWTNGNMTQTTAIASGLSPGVYSVSVVDALTSCQLNQTFTVTQPPALSLTINSSGNNVCATTSLILTPLFSGGTPQYTFNWANGPASAVYVTTQPIGGNYVYTVTVTDSKSCAITRTISLNYLNTHTLTVSDVAICPLAIGTLTVSGASSYTWNGGLTGNTFTASPNSNTVYSVTGSGSLCPITNTVAIFLKSVPTPTVYNTGPVCSTQSLQLSAFGGAGYSWVGPSTFNSLSQTPVIGIAGTNNSGIYQVTVTAANSCTASVSTTVLIHPTPFVSAAGSTVCSTQTLMLFGNSSSDNTFTWKGPNSFNSTAQNPLINSPSAWQSGNYTLTVTDPLTCTNSAVANVTVTAMPTVSFTSNSPTCEGNTLSFNSSSSNGSVLYNWWGPAGFTSNQSNPGISNVNLAANGTYSLNISLGPCVTGTTNAVLIYGLPTVAITGTKSVCETKTLSLSANASPGILNYNWYGPAAFTASTQSVNRYACIPSYSGIYTISVTDGNLCANSATADIKILLNPVLSVSDVTVCLNEPALLIAAGASSYLWSGPANFQFGQAVAQVPSATNSAPAQYTVVGTSANSCSSAAHVVLKTRSLPSPSLQIVPGPTLCLSDGVIFNGFGGVAYQWRGPNTLFFEGQTISLNVDNKMYHGSYTLTAIDKDGCRASIDTALFVQDLPAAGLMRSNQLTCIPFCSDFYMSSATSPSITATWMINKQNISGNSFSYCFDKEGTHVITCLFYDKISTCKNSIDFYVEAHQKPKADFTFAPLRPIENMDEVIFTNTSEGEQLNNFNWFFPPVNGEKKGRTSSLENAGAFFETEGVYPVALVVKNTWGCVDSTVKAIRVEADFAIYVPNAFTPNEDNRNEVFLPVTRAVKLYHLSIFNRWGDMIFETSELSSGWDGTYKGEACKSDVYAWKIKLTSQNGEHKELQGHVTLYR